MHALIRRTGVVGAGVLALCIGFNWTLDSTHAQTNPTGSGDTQPAFVAFTHAPLSGGALRAHIETLSSDALEGRAPGTAGERLTIDYITRAFALAGLQPMGERGAGGRRWVQNVPLLSVETLGEPDLSISNESGARTLGFGSDFVAWSTRAEPSVVLEDAELVFVGYGIVSAELGWNDYAGLDMSGKVAVILMNDPDLETGDDRGFFGRTMTAYGHWEYKFAEAARQGAIGAFIVHENAAMAHTWSALERTWTGPQLTLASASGDASTLAVRGWLHGEAARTLFAGAGLDFGREKTRAQRPDFTPVSLGQGASLALNLRSRRFSSQNVIGVLRGRAAADEYIAYTAHWDHLGRCKPIAGDAICNGSKDSASGVAGLIELARRFANEGHTDRSVLFIAFTAQQNGQLGSSYYVAHPTAALSRTAAVINVDRISVDGAARDIIVIGFGQSELEVTLGELAAAQHRGLTPDPFPEQGAYYASDQISFARLGVPSLYTAPGLNLYDGGVERGRAIHGEYLEMLWRTPDDEVLDIWDYSGAVQDLQLLQAVGAHYAVQGRNPSWAPASALAAPQRYARDTSD